MRYEVVNDRLVIDGLPVAFEPTVHVGGRIEPTAILLHDTAGGPPGDSVGWLRSNPKKISAHLVLKRDGKFVQLAEFDRRTNHAGDSEWRGRKGCNGHMIGIEIQNPGRLTGTAEKASAAFGRSWSRMDGIVYRQKTHSHRKAGWWLPYTEAQLVALEGGIGALARAYSTIEEVVGHHDVCVPAGRKEDPTPLMPWDRMRRALGIVDARREPVPSGDFVRQAQVPLNELGYDAGMVDGNLGPKMRGALRTFQEQNNLPITGQLDADTFDLLSNHAERGANAMPTGAREEAVTAAAGRSWKTRLVRWGAKLGIGLEVGKAGADAIDSLSTASDAIEIAEKGKDVIERSGELAGWAGQTLPKVLNWALSPKGAAFAITVLLCAAVWLGIRQIEKQTAAAERAGKRT